MSRHFTSLALSASLLLMSSAALAETTNPVCSLMNESVLASLSLTGAQPETTVVSAKATSCSWKSKAADRVLLISSEPSPNVMPMTCFTQQPSGTILTMCMVATGGSMLNVTLMQKGDKSEPKELATLRSHTEAVVAKLGKTAK